MTGVITATLLRLLRLRQGLWKGSLKGLLEMCSMVMSRAHRIAVRLRQGLLDSPPGVLSSRAINFR